MVLARGEEDGAAVLYLRAILLHCDHHGIHLKDSFRKYDPHGLGEIDKPLFKKMLIEWNVPKLTDEHFEQLVAFLDPDKDGHINTSVIISFRRTAFDKFILSMSCMAYLLYPFICKNCFKLIACRSGFVDGPADMYMMWDLRQACFEGDHLFMLLVIGIPALMIYLLGFPFIGYYILKKQKGKFGNDETLYRYGMFISGYREGYYHWESIVAFRKALFIGSSIFLSTYGPSMQTYMALLMILFFLFLHVSTNAYATDTLNRLESGSLIVSYLTLYIGLGFFMGTINGDAQVAMTVIIYMMNILFLIICVFILLKEILFMEEHQVQVFCKKYCCKQKEQIPESMNIVKNDKSAFVTNNESKLTVNKTKVMPVVESNKNMYDVKNGLSAIRKAYGAQSHEYKFLLLLIQKLNVAKDDESKTTCIEEIAEYVNNKMVNRESNGSDNPSNNGKKKKKK